MENKTEEDEEGETTVPAALYARVTVETPVDWRQRYDFYQAVIKPIAESGAEGQLRRCLEATREIDAKLVDLSVKESVVRFNVQGSVDAKSRR